MNTSTLSNDTLLHYLTTAGKLDNRAFGDAFQAVHDNRRRATVRLENHDAPDVADRRASMRLYGQLGFGDYDAARGMLRIQPPMMLLLPIAQGKGRRMLLTGGRTRDLLDIIKRAAPKFKVSVDVCEQHATNSRLLLPDRVELTSGGTHSDGFGLANLRQLALHCGIKFCTDLLQAGLLSFSVGLEEYRAALQPYTEELPNGWKQTWFDPMTVGWPKNAPENKDFGLVEFEFTVYRKQCYLWQDGQAYAVDKSWGRYLVLAKAGKNVLLHSQSQHLLAVPASTPFPELIARAAALLSGCAPEQRKIDDGGILRRYNIYQTPESYTMLYNKLPALLGQRIINVASL